nr:venom protein [Lampona murina]
MHRFFLLMFITGLLTTGKSITVDNCGLNRYAQGRIVGGSRVKAGAHPWMVSLLYDDGNNNFNHRCGGSILNENWIITAAHCLYNFEDNSILEDPSNVMVLAGLHRQSKKKSRYVQVLQVSKFVIHEKYDPKDYINDIALLKTARPIDIAGSNGYVNGICLPETNNYPVGNAVVAGWGHVFENGEGSDTLLHVMVPIVDRETCNYVYDDDPHDGQDQITETMICAGRANRDSCQNDSGGPLIQTSNTGIATLIGIVSNGAGCGERNFPGIYTKVSAYKEWIQNVMNEQ